MFPETRYEDWLQQLEKDLKGKPWTDLQWHLGDAITVNPFYHPDQYFPQRLPLAGQEGSWEIGERFQVLDLKTSNQEILSALEGGVEALELHLSACPSSEEWAVLLAGVQLEYISLHLVLGYAAPDAANFLQNLCKYLQTQGVAMAHLRGSIALAGKSNSWADAQTQLPQFKLAVVDGLSLHQDHSASTRELAALIQAGDTLLAESPGKVETLANSIQFKVAIGKSYFVEIAKLRALRILWFNVLKAYGIKNLGISIAVHFAPDSQDENVNTNMIRAATQAMSAIIGGATQLYVLPANAVTGEAPTAFSRRIARNVQHLLRLESHLDKVQDPAAGSFYIEKLTEELAEKAWRIFQG